MRLAGEKGTLAGKNVCTAPKMASAEGDGKATPHQARIAVSGSSTGALDSVLSVTCLLGTYQRGWLASTHLLHACLLAPAFLADRCFVFRAIIVRFKPIPRVGARRLL